MMELDASPMTPEEMKEILEKLGWNYDEMASALCIDQSTVRRYASGARSISRPVATLLRVIAEKHENGEE